MGIADDSPVQVPSISGAAGAGQVEHRERPAKIAVVGGGLAGLAAATALGEAGQRVELFESRRQLGGRAGSFRDPDTGDLIDHCQHVSLGCCTNLASFCRRTGIDQLFRRDARLHFFGPDGRRHDFAATRWLPVPAHLGPALWALKFLSPRERLTIPRTLLQLAREPDRDDPAGPTIGTWLRDHGQSDAAIELFWTPVLVSALGETVDRAGVRYARKVFVDGFMASRHGWEMQVPRAALGQIYGDRLAAWLAAHNVTLHLEATVTAITGDARRATGLTLADGQGREFDHVILAVPWRRCGDLFTGETRSALPWIDGLSRIEAAPITGLHLWFDRPITPLPHAVLVGRLSQWLFNREPSRPDAALAPPAVSDSPSALEAPQRAPRHYYQVVISASRELAGRDRAATIETIRRELCDVFPAARSATLLDWRMVSQPAAVFSVSPGIDALRPPQRTAIPNLFLAGDWTATSWPATMEGAVRGGHLAAEAVLSAIGIDKTLVAPDLPQAALARLLLN
jgi:squalene-associated FAD-dependent desaturase